MSEAEKQAFIKGYLEALYDYAWWKNGVMYVGCGVVTYKEAHRKFLESQGDKNAGINKDEKRNGNDRG